MHLFSKTPVSEVRVSPAPGEIPRGPEMPRPETRTQPEPPGHGRILTRLARIVSTIIIIIIIEVFIISVIKIYTIYCSLVQNCQFACIFSFCLSQPY